MTEQTEPEDAQNEPADASKAEVKGDPNAAKNIIPTIVEEEIKKSYLDYSMSVIVGRALPDARDGLKPVHRRVLFAMHDLGMLSNKPFKKSARIVGEVIGKYHPHGDSAAYDTLVRMAQGFSLRYPLIQGQGNFGSIDGDSAAAMRYTEARLAKISEDLLEDINKDTVDFQPNFDGELKEPVVLPCKIPNLLVNGSSGIAVGMATNIPPHNIGEVIDGTVHLIDNPDAEPDDLMQFVQGPDFPTGGIITSTSGIHHAYNTGKGKIRVRAKTHFEDLKSRTAIIISEIPYQVNKSILIEQIADLVRDKNITGIHDIRDESDRDGMRIVIELKADATQEVVLNQLFKHTRMESTFGMIFLGLVDNQPRILNLKELLSEFIGHRRNVVRRRTEFDLKKAEERAHILEGLITALNDIDAVVQKIKQSKDAETARSVLMADYSLSEMQAKAILEMRLQKLASLEQEKIRSEHKSLLELISQLKDILASEQRILDVIKSELKEMRDKYADPRLTEISEIEEEDISMEDLIEEEDMVVTITHDGYIKRTPVDTYRRQGRGGKGVIGATAKDEDFVEHLFVASTHSNVLFFTDQGQVHWLKVYHLPVGSRQAKGKAIVNLIGLRAEEKIKAFVPVMEFDDQHYLVFSTRNGTIKKTSLEQFSRPRKGGIRAITIGEGDELIDVVLTDGSMNLIIATKDGMAVRFSEDDVRPMGRAAAGVRGISLKGDDAVIGMVIADDEKTLLTATENGYGKRTPVPDYRLIKRGGVGVKNIVCSERNGCAVTIRSVTDDDELMLISQNGIIIRTAVKDISVIGRATQGVRIMRLQDGDRLMDAAKIINE
ncbi:DNA gyrase subunit A [Candidatus Woesearchaeota archaeon]|nr:DNA gyrase subunit A [Candidatus Woesearchaeota archaeon]